MRITKKLTTKFNFCCISGKCMTKKLPLKRSFIGHLTGEFVITKTLGKLIHNTNKKKKKKK